MDNRDREFLPSGYNTNIDNMNMATPPNNTTQPEPLIQQQREQQEQELRNQQYGRINITERSSSLTSAWAHRSWPIHVPHSSNSNTTSSITQSSYSHSNKNNNHSSSSTSCHYYHYYDKNEILNQHQHYEGKKFIPSFRTSSYFRISPQKSNLYSQNMTMTRQQHRRNNKSPSSYPPVQKLSHDDHDRNNSNLDSDNNILMNRNQYHKVGDLLDINLDELWMNCAMKIS